MIADPEKYEMIFSNQMTEDEKTIFSRQMKKDDHDLGDYKRAEIEYWYRYHNNGYCPQDTYPWIKEFNEYKAWADRIEHNAMNTLRSAISKILIDHENMNSFDGKLKKLFNVVHNHKHTDAKKKEIIGDRLGKKERSLDDTRNSIKKMLSNHP